MDFGYERLWSKASDPPALAIVLCTNPAWTGPTLMAANEYDDLVFKGAGGGKGPSVNLYYLNSSSNSFYFRRFGDGVFGPMALTPAQGALDPDARGQVIMQWLLSQPGAPAASIGTTIGPNDLVVLAVDTATEQDGIRRWTTGKAGKYSFHIPIAYVGARPSLNLIAHELCHAIVGKGGSFPIDLYGGDSARNARISLMGPEDDLDITVGADGVRRGGTRQWLLDPWHRVQLGFREPVVENLRNRGSFRLHAANLEDGVNQVLILADPRREFDRSRGYAEYFMVEYRTHSNVAGASADADCNCEGVVVWRAAIRHDGGPSYFEAQGQPVTWFQNSRALDRGVTALSGSGVRGGYEAWQSGRPLRWTDGTDADVILEFDAPLDPTANEITVRWRPVPPSRSWKRRSLTPETTNSPLGLFCDDHTAMISWTGTDGARHVNVADFDDYLLLSNGRFPKTWAGQSAAGTTVTRLGGPLGAGMPRLLFIASGKTASEVANNPPHFSGDQFAVHAPSIVTAVDSLGVPRQVGSYVEPTGHIVLTLGTWATAYRLPVQASGATSLAADDEFVYLAWRRWGFSAMVHIARLRIDDLGTADLGLTAPKDNPKDPDRFNRFSYVTLDDFVSTDVALAAAPGRPLALAYADSVGRLVILSGPWNGVQSRWDTDERTNHQPALQWSDPDPGLMLTCAWADADANDQLVLATTRWRM